MPFKILSKIKGQKYYGHIANTAKFGWGSVAGVTTAGVLACYIAINNISTGKVENDKLVSNQRPDRRP